MSHAVTEGASTQASQNRRAIEANRPHHRAVREHFGLGDAPAHLNRVAEWYVKPEWARGSVGVLDALFLYDMIRAVRPHRVVEIGTASGCSTALLARALADGADDGHIPPAPRVESYDISPVCYFDQSRATGAALAEMAPDLVTMARVHRGKTAADAARDFALDPFPFAFIDGNHWHPWPVADLLALLPALRPGAWVVLHDIRLWDVADRYEQATGAKVDWHARGPQWLIEGWPFERIFGVGGGENIGAIRLPEDSAVTADLLRAIIDQPWETTVPAEVARLLGRG